MASMEDKKMASKKREVADLEQGLKNHAKMLSKKHPPKPTSRKSTGKGPSFKKRLLKKVSAVPVSPQTVPQSQNKKHKPPQQIQSSYPANSGQSKLPVSDVKHTKNYNKTGTRWLGGVFHIGEAFLRYNVDTIIDDLCKLERYVGDIYETYVPEEQRGKGTAEMLCEAVFSSDELRSSSRVELGQGTEAAESPILGPLLSIRPSCTYVSDTFLPRRRAALLARHGRHGESMFNELYASRLVS